MIELLNLLPFTRQNKNPKYLKKKSLVEKMVFTGIINCIGSASLKGQNLVVSTNSNFVEDVNLGDSICVNGICLTVVKISNSNLTFNLSMETMTRAFLDSGPVHVEKALKWGSLVGGHFIDGHVQEIGIVEDFDQKSLELTISTPNNLELIVKDSISVNGVSLTIARLPSPFQFVISLVPYTLSKTNFANLSKGSKVNLEQKKTSIVKDHEYWMNLAIKEGEKGRYTASPNPWVGAVLVDKNNCLVGSEHHVRPGEFHAERKFDNMNECTLYVTLEPCCHTGRTPPCTDYILKSGVGLVVVGILDPDSRVSGKGVEILRGTGIPVMVGVCKESIEYSLRSYIWQRKNKTPYIVSKIALTQDNCYFLGDEWITGEDARKHAHGERASSQAIVIGSRTMEVDNPQLTVRYDYKVDRQPEKIVSTRELKWATHETHLQILVEGGPELQEDVFDKNLVNELLIYRSATISGFKGIQWSPAFFKNMKLVEKVAFENGDTMQRFFVDRVLQKSEPNFSSLDDAINALKRENLLL